MDTLKEKLAGTDAPEEKVLKKVVQTAEAPKDPAGYQDNLLAVSLIDPAVRDLLKEVTIEMIPTDERRAVFEYLLKTPEELVQDVPQDLKDYDTYVKILLLKADARYGEWNDEDRYFETARLVRQLITEHKKTQKNDLTAQLRAAEESGDDEKAGSIRQALNELIKEIPRAPK